MAVSRSFGAWAEDTGPASIAWPCVNRRRHPSGSGGSGRDCPDLRAFGLELARFGCTVKASRSDLNLARRSEVWLYPEPITSQAGCHKSDWGRRKRRRARDEHHPFLQRERRIRLLLELFAPSDHAQGQDLADERALLPG